MEDEHTINAEDCPFTTCSRKLRIQDLQKLSWLITSRDDLPWGRLSDLPLSQVRSARSSPLPGAVENSMLSFKHSGDHICQDGMVPPTLCGQGLGLQA